MQRYFFAAIIVCSALTINSRAATTEDLLSAKRARDQIIIQRVDKALHVAIDGGNPKDRGSDVHLTASEAVDLSYRDYNPLQIDVSASSKPEDDASQEALKKLFAALVGLPQVLGFNVPEEVLKSAGLGAESAIEPLDCCLRIRAVTDPCQRVQRALLCLDEELRKPVVTAADLTGWTQKATGRTGIDAVVAEIDARITSGNQQLAAAADLVAISQVTTNEAPGPGENTAENALTGSAATAGTASIAPLAANTGTGVTPQPAAGVASCDLESLQLIARLLQPQQRIDPKRRLVAALQELRKALAKVADRGNWTDPNALSDYRLLHLKPAPGKVEVVTVTVKEISYSLDEPAGTISIKTTKDDPSKVNLRLHQHSWFVTELAAGMIVTGIHQDEFGTGEDIHGKTVVKQVGRDKVDYGAALLFNGVVRTMSQIHPMWQIGVSSTEERPAFLFGGGLRLSSPAPLAVSAGGIVGWVQQLDALEVDDPVDGTAQIEEDLKREPDLSWYFSVQWTF